MCTTPSLPLFHVAKAHGKTFTPPLRPLRLGEGSHAKGSYKNRKEKEEGRARKANSMADGALQERSLQSQGQHAKVSFHGEGETLRAPGDELQKNILQIMATWFTLL